MGRAYTAVLAAAVLSLPILLALATFLTPLTLLGVPLAAAAAWLLPGRLWPDSSRRAGFPLLLFAGFVTFLTAYAAFLYAYGFSISAGLCGDRGATRTTLAVVVPYAIVGSWALRDRKRLLWAWPLATLSAAAVSVLVAYATPSAHGFCET